MTVHQQKFRIAIVERPQGWEPVAWNDRPERAVVVEAPERRVTREAALGEMFGFNCNSLRRRHPNWAVAVPGAVELRKGQQGDGFVDPDET